MHAPTRVPVVWSKISMAERVPVMVRLAVAVRIAGCPAVSAQIGMLGVTVRGMNAVPILAAPGVGRGVGRRVLLQAAGAFGPALSDRAGHASCPLGSEDTPGVGSAAFCPELQLAPGPEAGHWLPPSGSARRTGA